MVRTFRRIAKDERVDSLIDATWTTEIACLKWIRKDWKTRGSIISLFTGCKFSTLSGAHSVNFFWPLTSTYLDKHTYMEISTSFVYREQNCWCEWTLKYEVRTSVDSSTLQEWIKNWRFHWKFDKVWNNIIFFPNQDDYISALTNCLGGRYANECEFPRTMAFSSCFWCSCLHLCRWNFLVQLFQTYANWEQKWTQR